MLKETLHRMKAYFLNVLREEIPGLGTGVRGFHYAVRLLTHVGISLEKAHYLQRASALAYTTILSLVPVTALFVLYIKMAGKLDAISGSAQSWILRMFVAEAAQGVIDYINASVEKLNTRTLGTVGAAALLFTAYSLLRTIEKTLNDLWNVRKHRSIWARFQMLCSILVVVPTALVASLYFSGKVQEFRLFHDIRALPGITRAALVFVPFFLSSFSLFMLFKMMPNTWVRWRPALVSALVAATLFELAKWGFNLYVVKVIPVSKIYGSLGLIPVLLLWIYLCWVIVLFGVALGYVIQNLPTLNAEMRERFAASPFTIPVHEEWGLRIVEALARAFARGGGPQSSEQLAKFVELPVDAVEDHLGVLVKGEILAATSGGQGYVFTRPLEKLTVADVASTFRRQLSLPPRIDLREERTLAQLVGQAATGSS